MYVRNASVHCHALRVCGSVEKMLWLLALSLLASLKLQPDAVYGPLEYGFPSGKSLSPVPDQRNCAWLPVTSSTTAAADISAQSAAVTYGLTNLSGNIEPAICALAAHVPISRPIADPAHHVSGAHDKSPLNLSSGERACAAANSCKASAIETP